MMHAAEMFQTFCCFRDRGQLQQEWKKTFEGNGGLPLISSDELRSKYGLILAFDNFPTAEDVYGCQVPTNSCSAVVVGNERLGIGRDVQSMADRKVRLPMHSSTLNCLNVAAAAGVALYYLSRGGGAGMQRRNHPGKRRPEILSAGPQDHIELGSTIRSAAALGWARVLVDDRFRTWFGCDRVTRSEGRGAARRGRNPIQVVPVDKGRQYSFEEACVVVRESRGVPLHRVDLARGARQAIAIPDQSAIDIDKEDWSRLARHVTFAHLELPGREFTYHYRLIATIVLAEVARQVGCPPRPSVGPSRLTPSYDSSVDLATSQLGEAVYLEDLLQY